MPNSSAPWKEAFGSTLGSPPMSLRAGDAIDSGESQPAFDQVLDFACPDYYERHFWGLSYLDPVSWRYYLPLLLQYALDNLASPKSNAVDALMCSLRPPDRNPPRFASLSQSQQQAVSAVLEQLAFHPESAWQEPAIIALEEYWAPGATYR